MIRLAARQMRLPAISTAVLLVALCAVLAVVRHSMTTFAQTSGLSACLATGGDCNQLIQAFGRHYDVWRGLVYALGFAPALAGLFWGAPLIAREVEQGTHRLAWTQSVSRRRWLVVRVGLYLAGAVAVGALLTWLFTWWYGPLVQVEPGSYDSIQPQVFESHGVVLVATMLYAFALGTAAGALIRHTVGAMAVTVAGYAAERVFFIFQRSHLLPPVSITVPFGQVPGGQLATAWMLDDSVVDGAGHRAGLRQVLDACDVRILPGQGLRSLVPCADAHGFREVVSYQPLSRFWPLQFTESAIIAGLAVLFLVLASWWTLRRLS